MILTPKERVQDTMTGSVSLVQGLAGDADKAASMLHSLAPEVSLHAACDNVLLRCRAMPGNVQGILGDLHSCYGDGLLLLLSNILLAMNASRG